MQAVAIWCIEKYKEPLSRPELAYIRMSPLWGLHGKFVGDALPPDAPCCGGSTEMPHMLQRPVTSGMYKLKEHTWFLRLREKSNLAHLTLKIYSSTPESTETLETNSKSEGRSAQPFPSFLPGRRVPKNPLEDSTQGLGFGVEGWDVHPKSSSPYLGFIVNVSVRGGTSEVESC